MSVRTPPASMWLIKAWLAAGFRLKSALRASGGTARTLAAKSKGVTGVVFMVRDSSKNHTVNGLFNTVQYFIYACFIPKCNEGH
jgi:hypothetical protein